ncbi:MAG: hypothetical protein E7360_02105 [Clostridiales bacterium]|nr:hypothetical protein [Clostridiales bacterium]
MKIGVKNKLNILIGLLFVAISLLVASVGLRIAFPETVYTVAMILASVTCLTVAVALIVGMLYGVIKSKKKITPSKIRKKLTDVFSDAEKNFDKFANKLKLKNLFFSLYNVFITALGVVGYLSISFLFFKDFNFSNVIIILCTVAPIYRWVCIALKKDNASEGEGDINGEEFPETVCFIQKTAEEFWGKKINVKVFFSADLEIGVKKIGKTLLIGFNTYAFFLFTSQEIKALLYREIKAIKDTEYQKTEKLLNSREFYSNDYPIGIINGFLFSFIVEETVTYYEFTKNAIKRRLEKIKDGKVKDTEYAKDYITAYKKMRIFEAYLGDSRSYIYLNIYRQDEDLKNFTSFVFNHFQELYLFYGNSWTKQVENKLTAKVSEKLTYREKVELLGVGAENLSFDNNATEEMKCIYDKFGAEYYQTSKHFYEMRKQSFEEFDREIMRYEQNPEDYTERLKLIEIAHAYFSMGDLEKTEEVYAKILQNYNSPESNFDYGAFLLTVKKDERGVDYIYKAMENENLVDDGFELLGKYFILSGDEVGYEKFCEYKNGKMDEIIGGFADRILNERKKLKSISLDEGVLNEIIEVLTKDDNISEIYCADGKAKSGKTIFLFAIAVRNKTEDAFFETYERVFSILDNEYGKYDTFLLSVDNEKTRKTVKEIVASDKFLKFKR